MVSASSGQALKDDNLQNMDDTTLRLILEGMDDEPILMKTVPIDQRAQCSA